MFNEYFLLAQAEDGTTGGEGGAGGDEFSPAPDTGGGDAGGEAPAAPETVHDALTQAFDAAEKAEQEQGAQVEGALRGRDEKGRFVPREGQQQPSQRPTPGPAPTRAGDAARQPQPAQSALKPPPSWTPAAKEQWGKLPPAVQQEVYRRETEVGRAMQESSQARGMVQEFSGILAPYAHNIQAAGVSATEAIKNFFEIDNGLRHSTPLRKAQLAAHIINTYGIDLQMLDGVLAGVAQQDDPQQRLLDQLRGEFQRQLQPMHTFLQNFQGRQNQVQENLRAEVATEIANMEGREHFEELREDMADILESHSKRGLAMTMEQAYDRALRLHPTLYEGVARQNDAARAQRAREAAQRARAAAISRPSGAPAGHGAPAGANAETVRGAIEAAWDAHAES